MRHCSPLPLTAVPRAVTPLTAVPLLVALAACGGGGSDTSGPPDQQTLSVAMATPSGNAQVATVSTQLADPLRVIVRRDGSVAAGVTVAWSVASGGGSIAPTSSATDPDGIATAAWTLGPTAGAQEARATVQGATGSPVAFTANGTPGPSIVLVTNNVFSPETITVTAGTVVTWEWPAGSVSHNIIPVAPANRPDSPEVRNGPATYQVVFKVPGVYRYYCSVHGTPTSGMRGMVVVLNDES